LKTIDAAGAIIGRRVENRSSDDDTFVTTKRGKNRFAQIVSGLVEAQFNADSAGGMVFRPPNPPCVIVVSRAFIAA